MALTQQEMTVQLEQAVMLIDDVRNALENEQLSPYTKTSWRYGGSKRQRYSPHTISG